MSETPLTDSPALDLARQLQKHYSDKGQFFIAADFSNLRNQIELDARSLELQVTSLTAKLAEKEASSETWKETAEAAEESVRNLAAFAKDDACFSLPMSGASITARDTIRSLRNDLCDAAEHLNAVYRQLDIITSQLAAARKDSERVEKLRWYTVNVRQPMRYGSLNIFYANPGDGDEEDVTPSDLREQIDALPPAPTTE